MGRKPKPDRLPPPPKYHSLIGFWRAVLFGRPLPTHQAGEGTLSKILALPILSSNALSSNAYATEAILAILILKGTGALHFSIAASIGICLLLVIVSLSYIQIIYAYPKGGGAYPVSKDNLSTMASLIAGASLMVDYMLTVAVSVAAGVAAVITVYPSLHNHIVELCIGSIVVLTAANVRGVRESGTIFAWPTYAFILAIISTEIAGLIGLWTHAAYMMPAANQGAAIHATNSGLQTVGWLLLLQAFSQGCAALTGLEAISNTVPLFEKPQDKNAASTMIWMGVLAVVMFFGLTYVSDALGIVPMSEADAGYRSVVGMVADKAWPPALHWMFGVVQWTTAIVLLLAANTAFAGFPQLASMMARDRFLPRQLANLGDRLAFSNGIVILAVIATFLILVFHGRVDALLPMYAIGVFIGFTLAQSGMVIRWRRSRAKGWRTGIFFNGLGAISTGVVSMIIGLSKFDNGDVISRYFHFGSLYPRYGTWIVLVLIPILVTAFYKTNKHYLNLKDDLSLSHGLPRMPTHNTVLLLVPRLHIGMMVAANYASLIGTDVWAVHIETDPETTDQLKKDWAINVPNIPLLIIESPFRSLVGPLLRYIEVVKEQRRDDIVTVVVPELVAHRWWHRILHTQTGPILRFALFNRKDVVIVNVRYFLER